MLRLRIGLLSLFCAVLFSGQTYAQDANVYSVSGSVQSKPADKSEWVDVAKGADLSFGDEIRTGDHSRVGLKLNSGKLIRLRSNSFLKLAPPKSAEDKKGRLSLVEGVMYLFSRGTADSPDVETPEVSAAIRGTEMIVSTRAGITKLSVLEGEAELSNKHGAARVKKGEEGSATAGSKPVTAVLVSPTDAVQWALLYPSVLSLVDFHDVFNDSSRENQVGYKALVSGNYAEADKHWQQSSWQGEFGHGLTALMQGNLSHAAQHAASLKNEAASAVLTSAVALRSGEIEQIQGEGRFKGAPGSIRSAHLAQRAVIALVHNEKALAAKLVDAALGIKADSVSALRANAYVQQGHFNVEAAAESIALALEVDPDNPELMARAAELELAQGHVNEAVAQAREAYGMNPMDPGVLKTMGYSYLTRYETDKAIEYFQKALDTGVATGDAHLGYGLALIREGQLEKGREHIEQAVHLEPTRSMYRSYLGKAFFEEEREDAAQNEYGLAIELDENDPTPYLYRAFNNLSRNRVVNALEDVESSIERNDNRAVYRSQFLLDQDEAVRSTSLGEVFEQLGFDKIAELEALRSINLDYTNFSAHRLFSETLDGDFFSDARFTEGLLSDLLSPVSFNVFQDFSGFQSDASLNDYSALFDRPEHRTGIELDATTEDDFISGSVFQNGKEGNFGYFLGYSGDYGSGRKSNGDYFRRNRFDFASQYQLDYNNRVIAQTGISRRDAQGAASGLTIDDFEVAVGSFHRFSANSKVITRLEYFDRESDDFEDGVIRGAQESITLNGMDFFFDEAAILIDETTEEDFEAVRASAQHMYNTDLVSFVTGAQYLDTEGEGQEESLLLEDSAGFFTGLGEVLRSQGEFDTSSYSLYTYSTWHVIDWLDLNAGVNYTDIELPAYDVIAPFIDGERSADKWSPKFGFSIYPTESLKIRGAYFQNLGISSVSDIGTIEPANLGTFVQAYGDLPGVETENYGIGMDYKMPNRFYTGVEYIYRDIERAAVNIDNTFDVDFDALTQDNGFRINNDQEQEREHLIKAYLYGVLTDSLVATLDYSRAALNALDINERNDTDKISVALRYFSPQRWFAFSRATWRKQGLRNVADFENGENDFWVVDAGLGYRIPKRHGSVQLIFSNILDDEFEYADRGREAAFASEFAARLVGSVNF